MTAPGDEFGMPSPPRSRPARSHRWAAVLPLLLVAGCSALAPPIETPQVEDGPAPVTVTSREATEVEPAPVGSQAGRWAPAAPPPLGPRVDPAVVWNGTAVLVFGGSDPACPALGPCPLPPLRDGATYDPRSGTWRAVDDLPVGLDVTVAAPTPDGMVVGRPDGTPWRYDAGTDDWSRMAAAPDGLDRYAVAGDRMVAYAASQQVIGPADHLFDPFMRRWQPVPRDPLGPMEDRQMVWVGRSLVLTGTAIDPEAGGVVRAARLDDALDDDAGWTELPDGPVTPGTGWVGTRVGLVRPVPSALDPDLPATEDANGPDPSAVTDVGASAPAAIEAEPSGAPIPSPGASPSAPDDDATPVGAVLRLDPAEWYALPRPFLPAVADQVPVPLDVPPAAEGRTVVGGVHALDLETGTWATITTDRSVPADAEAIWAGDRVLVWGGTGLGATAATWHPPWAEAAAADVAEDDDVDAVARLDLLALPGPAVPGHPPPGPGGRPDARIDCTDEARTRLTDTYAPWNDGRSTPQQALHRYLLRQADADEGVVVIVDRIHASVLVGDREVVAATALQRPEGGWVAALLTACGDVNLIIE